MQSYGTDQHDRAANPGRRAGLSGPRKLGGSAHRAAVRPGTSPTRRLVKRLTVFVAGVSAAGAIVGCGGAGSVAKEIGVAACRQAASSLSDPQARQIADQACQIGATGSLTQATQAAKQAAHDACVNEAQRIVDQTARQQIAAVCPTAK